MPSALEPRFPYRDLPENLLVKVQALISVSDKNAVASVVLDRGVHTLLIQQSYHLIASYVRRHSLTYSDSARLLDAIADGSAFAEDTVQRDATPRPAGSPSARDDAGPTPGVLGSAKSRTNQRLDPSESRPRKRKG